ncbi:hypothetical protein R5R35_009008 [Gryllus longicercus]|uniref:Odorant binding protein n=1 Tax=Gryllus longicercus TaxID=2509291 RepID=A0AAN9VEY8_9ORTH
MRWYAVLLLAALTTSLEVGAAGHARAAQRATRSISRNFQDEEKRCREKSGVSKEQVLRSGCRKPSDPELEGRVMVYSLCYLVNFHQMTLNGTFIFTPFTDCSATALADTSTTSHLTHKDRAMLCQMQTVTYDCQREIGGRNGLSAQRKAMEYRLCLCEGFMKQVRSPSPPTISPATSS